MAAGAAGLLAGVALLVLACPILAGSAAALPGDEAARALRHRAQVTDDALLGVITSRTRALGYYDVVDWRRELATASIIPRGGQPVAAASVARGMAQTRAALEAAPASPQDWLRLAILESMAGDNPQAAHHLSTALLTGADMPRLRTSVVELGFTIWRDLPGETRAATLDVLRHAWQAGRPPERLALLAQARERGFLPLAVMALSEQDGLQEALATQ
jgi:hypothetical protein